MAKKSAASKGYRKTVKKKPFLTKKEIIELIVIVAVIALAVILFNLFYDDGYLRSSDVQPGDVVSYVSREVDNRYVKVAEANDLTGFTRTEPDMSTNGRVVYTYIPDEETDNISTISLSGSYLPASEQAANSEASMRQFGTDSLEFTPQQETTIQGHDAYVYSYTFDYYSEELAAQEDEAGDFAEGEEAPAEDTEAPAEDAEETAEGEEGAEPASNSYNQTVGCYVDVGDYTICFHIYRTGSDDSFYLPEDEIMDYLLPYTDAFTVYEKEAK